MLRSIISRSFSTAVPQFSGKLKHPAKRAAHLMQQLNEEEVAKSFARNHLGKFKPGDAVEVEMLLNKTTTKIQRVKGVVIGERNRGLSSSFIIRNHIAECGYEQKIFIHSPLLHSVKVLKEKFISNGKKKVRRAKLYYLRDKAPRFTTV
ncbi:50S ribosomal protein L19 [Saprolegnia diclina VS20]|uniref:50S ribosomal protein L19, chloroplastic n=1 Tax=Saprolegnia diclina (strain VS20) TaxID=1156394 RepID=T0Q066_SAPDV|nr:50S ribosomal protein L19 [Saprolegnia diclina VS20]EQC26760.1 50S ribosomal protein L19 [Saprolegnia diclina VS20]|eukprot:XP_008619803.1 50S ribosomal protein L19 [Saprolegnia diclina VS20]